MNVSSVAPVLTPTVTPSATALSSRQDSNASAVSANQLSMNKVSAPGLAVGADQQATNTRTTNERAQVTSVGDLQQALEDVQSAISVFTSDLLFSIDEDTGRTVVKIVDRETDEVIKQIPSEEMLRMAKALDKLQGLLVKQEV